jgi:hypothetical protein
MSSSRVSNTGGVALVALLLAALALALAMLAPASAGAEEACPNAALRFGPSANLPDCRAYELVTPAVKEDNSFIFGSYGFSDGEHVYFTSALPLPGAQDGTEEPALSSRTPSGWATTPLTVPQGPGVLEGINGGGAVNVSFTTDFSSAFIQSRFAASPLDQNLDPDVYRVDIPNGLSSLESLPDTGPMTQELYGPLPPPSQKEFVEGSFPAGNSADGSHVFFETRAHLPTAPGTPRDTHLGSIVLNELYERHDGHTYVVGVLPDGTVAPCGAEVGEGGSAGVNSYSYDRYGAVSPDGSNVVFKIGVEGPHGCEGGEAGLFGQAYLREDNGTPQARTVELPGKFYLGRTANGSKVLSDGGPGGNAEGEAIYEYDIPSGQATIVGHGALLAYSANGSVVYYLTNASQFGSEQQSDGGRQLMVYDDGTTKAVTGAGSGPGYAGSFYESGVPSYVGLASTKVFPVATPDGSKLLFLDAANLTGYDTFGPSCVERNSGATKGQISGYCAEAYIYDLHTGSLTCVSCNPAGTPPVTNVNLYIAHSDTLIPPTTALLSGDGSRAFFQTAEALVPQDTNGANDVYEWENGRIYLISSGQGGSGVQEFENVGQVAVSGVIGSTLVGASSSGNDVFIATADHLAPQVVEDSEAIYDVRVDGGFPYTPAGHGCGSGQCQGPQTPAPIFAPPASATFIGVGNPASVAAPPSAKSKAVAPAKCKKGFVKKNGRCVKKPKARKVNRQGKGRK